MDALAEKRSWMLGIYLYESRFLLLMMDEVPYSCSRFMRRRPKMGSEAQKSMAITGGRQGTAGGGGDAIHRNPRDKH